MFHSAKRVFLYSTVPDILSAETRPFCLRLFSVEIYRLLEEVADCALTVIYTVV